MILAWRRDVVSDREHGADVMKKMDGRARVAEGRALEISCVGTFIIEGVRDWEHESTHSSQKTA